MELKREKDAARVAESSDGAGDLYSESVTTATVPLTRIFFYSDRLNLRVSVSVQQSTQLVNPFEHCPPAVGLALSNAKPVQVSWPCARYILPTLILRPPFSTSLPVAVSNKKASCLQPIGTFIRTFPYTPHEFPSITHSIHMECHLSQACSGRITIDYHSVCTCMSSLRRIPKQLSDDSLWDHLFFFVSMSALPSFPPFASASDVIT